MTPMAPGGFDSKEGRDWLAGQLALAREEFAATAAVGRGGTHAQARYSDRVDDIVRRIVAAALEGYDLAIAVAALGGYGRRAMCLHRHRWCCSARRWGTLVVK